MSIRIPTSTPEDVLAWLSDTTPYDLENALGPQWQEIVALARRSRTLTAAEVRELSYFEREYLGGPPRVGRDEAAHNAHAVTWWVAWPSAIAALNANSHPRERVAQDAATQITRCASALCARDMIGKHDFTQKKYDSLTMPCRMVIGRVHPDDAEVCGLDIGGSSGEGETV